MKCSEFWQKAYTHLENHEPDHLEASGPLKEHLRKCKRCAREWDGIRHGFSQLREDIHNGMDPSFWHDMRLEVRSQIKRPDEQKWYQGLFPRSSAWVGALAASLVALFFLFHFHGQTQKVTRFLASQDVVAMFEQSDPFEVDLPTNEIDSRSLKTDMDNSEELTDPYLLTGVSDSWSGVLDEVDQDEPEIEMKERPWKDKTSSVSLVAPKRACYSKNA